MQTTKTKNTVLIAAILLACGTITSLDAGARERGRSVHRTAHEGSVSAHRDNARFESERERNWQRDGEGNASMERSGSITGAKGGSAERQGSIERSADGSLSHQASGSGTTANGGTVESSGGFTRDADGNVNGSRNTTATGANGATYNGSTTWSNGQATHAGSVTGANGGTVEANGNYTRGDDGKVSGTRTTDATGARGATYNGSTTIEDGKVTHTGTCTNAAGETVDCPSRSDGGQ
jgi:hypothetical protein